MDQCVCVDRVLRALSGSMVGGFDQKGFEIEEMN